METASLITRRNGAQPRQFGDAPSQTSRGDRYGKHGCEVSRIGPGADGQCNDVSTDGGCITTEFFDGDMESRPRFDVDSWDAARAIVEYVVPDALVTVSKGGEPTLPRDLSMRRSNVPWSIHKGAWRVYRDDRPGEHLQIREYDDHWTVELDHHNPHYRPLRHVAVDTPTYIREAVGDPFGTTTDLVAFGPLRTAQFTTTAALTPVRVVDDLLTTVIDLEGPRKGN